MGRRCNPQKNEEAIAMDVIVAGGCGLGVHRETEVACIDGGGIKKEIRHTALSPMTSFS